MVLTGMDGTTPGSSRMAKAEEEFQKSINDLVSTTLAEGAKVPGRHGVALTSNVLWLVPKLPLNPVLVPCIDLLPEKECKIIQGDLLKPASMSHSTPSLLPSSPLTGEMNFPMSGARSTI